MAVSFKWVQGPDGEWVVAKIGPDPFAVRIPGCDYIFSQRDFTMGPDVAFPDMGENNTAQ